MQKSTSLTYVPSYRGISLIGNSHQTAQFSGGRKENRLDPLQRVQRHLPETPAQSLVFIVFCVPTAKKGRGKIREGEGGGRIARTPHARFRQKMLCQVAHSARKGCAGLDRATRNPLVIPPALPGNSTSFRGGGRGWRRGREIWEGKRGSLGIPACDSAGTCSVRLHIPPGKVVLRPSSPAGKQHSF